MSNKKHIPTSNGIFDKFLAKNAKDKPEGQAKKELIESFPQAKVQPKQKKV
jgi:hypothetical protein